MAKRLGVKETPLVPLAGGTTLLTGQILLVNGVPTAVPVGQASVSAWAASIGGSPTIAACDMAARKTAFLPVNHPLNMDQLGHAGLPLFEV